MTNGRYRLDCPAARSADSSCDAPANVDPILQSILGRRAEHFGMAAAVLRRGRIVAQDSAGVRMRGTAERITIADRFHLGSYTKAMTATLVEESKLNWTTTLLQKTTPKKHVPRRTVRRNQQIDPRTNRIVSTVVRTICFTILLSVLPFRASAEGLTNAIHAFLQHRGESEKRPGGIVVGLVDEHGSSVISYGTLDNGTDKEVNGDTVFGIHSQTCVYTALLLEDMIERGEMKLDDPVAEYLPKSVRMPTYEGKQITLRHLVTETSGLPNFVDQLDPRRADNPFAEYTIEKMYGFLSSYKLSSEPGKKFEHGGVGMGLLGHAIALKAGTNFESLVVDRILRPLGMESTGFTLNPELTSRLATEHTPAGYARPTMDWGVLAPLAGLRSTPNDLLRFVSVNLGLSPSNLKPLVDKYVPRFVWGDSDDDKRPIIEFGGGGMFNTAYCGFDKTRRRGVVVLSTSDDGNYNALAIGRFLLQDCEWQSDRRPTEAKISSSVYDSYVGQYRLNFKKAQSKSRFWPFSSRKAVIDSQASIGIRREGDRFFVQTIGKSSPSNAWSPPGTAELLPQTENRFFERLSGVPVVFSQSAGSNAICLTVDYHGKAIAYEKISDQPPIVPEPPKPHVAIKLNSRLLDACVGQYEVAPNAMWPPGGAKLVFWREGDHLVLRAWGKDVLRGAVDVYPESETNFFVNFDGTQFTFFKNDKGEVTSVISRAVGVPDSEGKKLKTD